MKDTKRIKLIAIIITIIVLLILAVITIVQLTETELFRKQELGETILSTKISFEPNEYTNKESEKILIKISNSKGIKSIKCLDNDIIIPQKNQTEVTIDYTVTKNGNYQFVIIVSEGK